MQGLRDLVEKTKKNNMIMMIIKEEEGGQAFAPITFSSLFFLPKKMFLFKLEIVFLEIACR